MTLPHVLRPSVQHVKRDEYLLGMKLTQKQLRSLVESIVSEVGPDRGRVDNAIGNEAVAPGAQELGLELAGKIINDRSLKLRDRVLQMVASTLATAGVGGSNLPAFSAADIVDTLGEDEIDGAMRELEGGIATMIGDFAQQVANSMSTVMSDTGAEHDELSSDDYEYVRPENRG